MTRQTPTCKEIWAVVAQELDLPLDGFRIQGRSQNKLSHGRQVAMWIARNVTKLTYTQIGRAFGGRDHSTVMHAFTAVENRRRKCPVMCSDIDSLHHKFGPIPPPPRFQPVQSKTGRLTLHPTFRGKIRTTVAYKHGIRNR